MLPKETEHSVIISGWKSIATYLGKGVRTVQRYERDLRLPVRRPAGKSMGSVIATKTELDAWVMASSVGELFRLSRPRDENDTALNEFRQHIKELHRLREESAQLREGLHVSLELLRSNLRSKLLSENPVLGEQSSRVRAEAPLLISEAKRSNES